MIAFKLAYSENFIGIDRDRIIKITYHAPDVAKVWYEVSNGVACCNVRGSVRNIVNQIDAWDNRA